MTTLPAGWAEMELQSVVEVRDSLRQPVNAEARAKRQGAYPYYGANGQAGTIDEFRYEGEHVLVAEDGGFFDQPWRGVAYRVDGRFWVNNHAHVLRAGPQMLARFLELQLNTLDWMKFVSGTTRLKLTQAAMNRIPLRVPPLDTQRRIVAKLDALLAQSRAAREQLEAVPDLVETYRQSTLASALAACRESSTERLADLAELITSGSRGWGAYYADSGARFMRVGDLRHRSTELRDSQPIFVRPPPGAEGARTRLRPGDVLVSITADVGMVGLVPDNLGEAYVNQHLALVRLPSSSAVSPQFLAHVLLDPRGLQAVVRKLAYGATKASLSLTQVRELRIPVPSPTDQALVVRRVRHVMLEADRLLARLELTEDLGVLERSLLAQAFRGDLDLGGALSVPHREW